MGVSSIPGVLSYLVALGRTVCDDVHDGPPSVWLAGTSLIIGSENGVAATDTREQTAGYSDTARTEHYEVSCLAWVWSGDTDDPSMAGQRQTCFDLIDAFDQTIAVDKTLGGLVMLARISRVDAYQVLGTGEVPGTPNDDDGPGGRAAYAVFTVEVTNMIR